ncbi:hypothetical protein ACIQC9_00965 [Brevundimonas sp. NPDC092305]
MALLDPHRSDAPRTEGSLHPCLYLIAGFGVITAAAIAVHLVFNTLV